MKSSLLLIKTCIEREYPILSITPAVGPGMDTFLTVLVRKCRKEEVQNSAETPLKQA